MSLIKFCCIEAGCLFYAMLAASSEKCKWIQTFCLIAGSSNELFVNGSSWKTSQAEILKLEISFFNISR